MNQTETTLRDSILSGILIYVMSCLVLSGTLTYVVANMDTIINRDPVAYWDRAYALYQTLANKGFLEWAEVILRGMSEQHTQFPAALPSLAFWVLSDDSLAVYGAAVVLFYLAPIPVVAAFVNPEGRTDRSRTELVVTGLVLLAAMYPFAARRMPTSPDFGGNLFMSMGILLAASVLHNLWAARDPSDLRPRNLALKTFGFLACLVLATLFRRWFAFDAFGLALMFGLIYLGISVSRGKAFAFAALKWLLAAGALAAVLLAPVVIKKLLVVSSSGVLSGAYDAYRDKYLSTFRSFGLPELIAFAALAGLAVAVHRKSARPFLVVVLIGNTIGILLFLYIQAPGGHHFAILWPMILASVSVTVSRLFDLGPKVPTVVVSACLVGLSVAAIAVEFPAEPRVSRYMGAYKLVADKILDKKIVEYRYCVLGNVSIHPSVVNNLWQVKGGRRGAVPRAVQIPEVDVGLADSYGTVSINRAMSHCDWILTMEKLGLNRAPKYHRILRYHHQRIFDPNSVLGRAYEIEDKFEAGFNNPVVFFKRKPGTAVDAASFRDDYLAWLAQDKIDLP